LRSAADYSPKAASTAVGLDCDDEVSVAGFAPETATGKPADENDPELHRRRLGASRGGVSVADPQPAGRQTFRDTGNENNRCP
jgi:hypothetical protein